MNINIFNSETIFGSKISAETFFKDYWQKKPLLIRGAFANDFMQSLISPEELAGFSLEEDIESRLISQFDGSWDLAHGPLDESVYQDLPEENWTLLVQSLDYFHEPLQSLIQACNFMPRWRLDDVMVSFATDKGGVGPHLDQYDVFLIQGIGKRRWRVGHKDQTVAKHCPHPEISQIEAFAADMDIEVEAGDLLYIPPNTPHWGESISDSMCYSVGFRAPNLEAITQQLLEESSNELNQLWQDENLLNTQSQSGELPQDIHQWAIESMQKAAFDHKLKIAIGKEVTQLKYPELLPELGLCEAQELSELTFLKPFKLNSLSRLAFFKETDKLMVFINGEYFAGHTQDIELLETLNNYQTIKAADFTSDNNKTRELLTGLIMASAIEFIEE
ncbi:MAG: cupin domain-containing protein [Gammaproteobacteria bacterium]|nr:cupin domain-containing protein [Gammaproteobacteria bacterium]